MSYRHPDQQRTVEALRDAAEAAEAARAAEMLPLQQRFSVVVAEVSRLDHILGEWSASVPDGTLAPPEALRLMDDKARLEVELRLLGARLAAYASSEPIHEEAAPGLMQQVRDWLRRL